MLGNQRSTKIGVKNPRHAALPPHVGLGADTVWAGGRSAGPDPTAARQSKKDRFTPFGVTGADHHFTAGQTVFWEDDDADYLFEVLSGTVSVSRSLADGRRQVLDFRSTGDLLGLTIDDTYRYTADAVTAVTAVRYWRHGLEARIGNNPALARHLLATAIEDIRVAHERILLLGCKSATERVASFLLTMAGRPTHRGGIDDPLDLPMARRDIADYLGLTVETVSRTLAQFERDGIIALSKPNRVAVLRAETLYEFAERNLDALS